MSDGKQTINASGVTDYFDTASEAIAELHRGRDTTIVGALPFHTSASTALFTPRLLWHNYGAPSFNTPPGKPPSVINRHSIPAPADHVARVAHAIESIRRGNMQKIVLSRAEHYLLSTPIDPEFVLQRFMENSASGFGHLVRLDNCTSSHSHGRYFVGSSPELLIYKKGSYIKSHPLAGTIPRSADCALDKKRADALRQSKKDIAEHRFVTEDIREKLAPLCRNLSVPDYPSLTSTSHTWHLGTVIEGELHDADITALELAQLLHPTAAVNGTPAPLAAEVLMQQEPHREFYAGAVGWSDSTGDGQWRVGIRSVELHGDRAIAIAGGGIVANSNPTAELAETEAKFGPARQAIGVVGGSSGDHTDSEVISELSPLNFGPANTELLATGLPKEIANHYRKLGLWQGNTHWDLFRKTVSRCPDAQAVTDAYRSLTWNELSASVDQAAAFLISQGIRRGDGVIVQLPNSIVFLETLLAIWKIGAIAVFSLPAHGSKEISHFAAHAPAQFYISTAHPNKHLSNLHQALETPLSDGRVVQKLLIDETAPHPWPAAQELAANMPAAEVSADELAFLQLSGGTSGVPKLIPKTHNDYLYSVRASLDKCDFHATDTLLVALPAAHNFTMSSPGILGALVQGAHIVFSPSPMPMDVLPLIQRHGITHLALVPAALLGILNYPKLPHYSVDSVRTVWVGGAKLSKNVALRVLPELGWHLQQVFGMAEGLVNYTQLNAPIEEIVSTQGRPMSPYDEILVVDDNDNEVEPGQTGHLLTRGPYTIRGYHRAPEVNAQSFTSDGFYRTGDIVTFSAGNLTVVGRAKEQINRGGEKIAPEAVENVLLKHPLIHDASVIGAPDETLGEKIRAFVIPREGSTITALEVRKYIRNSGLSSFSVPDQVDIVSEFPVTAVGKVSKRRQAQL